MLLRKLKRVGACVLSAITVLSLAACGKGDSQTEHKEFVYVPEYIEMNNAEEANLYNMQVAGNCMYYFQYSWDEATMTSSTDICEYNLDTGEINKLPITMGENRNVQNYVVDEQRNLYTIEYQWMANDAMTDYSENYFLCKYDAQGNVVLEQDITDVVKKDDEYGYISNLIVDANGRFYAAADDKIRLFDTNGSYVGDVSVDGSWIQGMGIGKDGKVYITYYDQTSADGGYVLTEIAFESRQLGTSYQNFPNGNGNGMLAKGLEGDFLVNDGNRVYEYSMETQTATELLAWLDSDINGTYVNYVGALENGKLFAVINDWSTNKTELAALTKTKYSELPEKIQVTIGTLYEDQSLQAAAVAFNKQNDTYHVNIKSYIDTNNWTETSWQDGINNLNNDIVSGSNCPDILDLSQLNVEQLAAKGVFEDLTPYLESSAVVGRDDFLESIVNAYTVDGKLISIPKSFSLTTIAGKASEVGTEMGWTLEEMMAYAEEHPDASLFDYASKAMMITYLLQYNQDSFIDWATGECKFESEEFINILEFVEQFPDEFDWEADERSTPVKIQSGDVLLDMVGIYELNSIQEYDAIFNEPVTFIGYPNSSGDSGCYLTANQCYAIASKSKNKEGAWAFIEDYLSKEADNMFSWGLPTNKSELDAMIEEETKVEYVTDANGKPVLDEEGNPIVMGGGSSIGYGDWEYTYHVVTQEEVDRVLELIEVAKPVSVANQEIMTIITEEAEGFFQGQKTAAEVAAIIQSRVKIYVSENS